MDIKKLNDFINLAKESGVSELQYENGKEKYVVKMGGSAPLAMPAYQAPQVAAPQAPAANSAFPRKLRFYCTQ